MGDASRSAHPYSSCSYSDSNPPRHHSHGLFLPSFHDFHASTRHDPAAGPSRSRGLDHQHFMNSVNAANAGTNGSGGAATTYYDEQQHSRRHTPMTGDPTFDILDWYPAYQSCQRYFLDVAQHEPGTQALCALINIRLPFQYHPQPITSSAPPANPTGPSASTDPNTRSPSNPTPPQTYPFTFSHPSPTNTRTRPGAATPEPPAAFVSLVPYIRRLTITGFDKPAILHGLFGDDYPGGILPHLDCERRNYLFAAKHGGWRTCKKQYDVGSGACAEGGETVPFMKPLEDARGEELLAAEKAWSRWLAMEDWMVGPHAPVEGGADGASGREGDGNVGRRDRGGEEERRGLPNGVPEALGER